MHRLAPRHLLGGSTKAAAFVVALAVLVQAVAALPLALHLAAAAGFDSALAAFPLCGGSAGDRPDTGGQTGDNHEHCLTFCQGVFGAAALPGPMPLLAAAMFAAIVFSFSLPSHRPLGRIAGYASRGPPFAIA
jgi:hypothetical protein